MSKTNPSLSLLKVANKIDRTLTKQAKLITTLEGIVDSTLNGAQWLTVAFCEKGKIVKRRVLVRRA